MRRPIVVVGSINLDLVCAARRIPAPGETIRGDKFQTFHGGKGANQAVAAARLGYPVAMVGKVGSDDFGRRLRQGLRDEHIGIRAVTTAADTASGVALITVDANGQNSIVVVPGANDELRPRDLEAGLSQLRSAGIILTQLEIPMETVECLTAIAQRHQIPLMLDPAPARPVSRKLLKCVTWLTPNETEIATLCGISPAELTPLTVSRFAQYLQGGASNVIVKMGSRGAFIRSSDGAEKMIPAFRVKAVDTTAAGDAFNAGLAVALMQGLDLPQAVRYGSAVGALSATRAGAQPSMPSNAEVAGLLDARNGKSSRSAAPASRKAASANGGRHAVQLQG